MLNRLSNMITGPDVPKLFVAKRVVEKMARAAQQYVENETGEAMIGLVIPDKATGSTSVYVVDTIAPGDDVVRASHTFQQGSAWQDEILHWLRENWEVARRKRATSYGTAHNGKWNAPLYHIGDWHKQPGFMIQPSGGDLMTAMDWVNQQGNRIGFMIAPILTIDHPATVEDPDEMTNFLRVEQPNGLMTRIDFWFIARNMVQFYPVKPNLVEDHIFPRLMDYPWHLTSQKRAEQEISLLEGDGMLVEILLWDTDEDLPLEVCFLTARPNASHFLLVATQHDYPNSPPDVYKLPFTGIQPNEDLYDLMGRIWTHAELVDVEDFEWTPQKTLLETIYVVEQALGWNTLPTSPEGDSADAADDGTAETVTETGEDATE